jgi:hypothetical protein
MVAAGAKRNRIYLHFEERMARGVGYRRREVARGAGADAAGETGKRMLRAASEARARQAEAAPPAPPRG